MGALKIYSWNVNGIRAVINKGAFSEFMKKHQPDILCLQETKAQQGQAEIDMPQYEEYWCSAEKKGYSGTAIFTKVKPTAVTNGLPEDIIAKFKVHGDVYGDPNKEGRVITAEFDKFFIVGVYTINIKDDLSRLGLRQGWDKAFLEYVQRLESGSVRLDGVQGAGEQRTEAVRNGTAKEQPQPATPQSAMSGSGAAGSASRQAGATNRSGKPVVFCGDLNVAHTEEDLARPKENVGKRGFTDEERAGFQELVNHGFIDTFRLFKQGNGHYTWWTHWANARARNVGWRIDYFLVSKNLRPKIKAAEIHPDIMGSDHCPVSIIINV